MSKAKRSLKVLIFGTIFPIIIYLLAYGIVGMWASIFFNN